jgi:hypothetical protein
LWKELQHVARLSCPVSTTNLFEVSGRKVCVECPAPPEGSTVGAVGEESGVMKCYMSDGSNVDATQTTDPSIEFEDPISMPNSSAPQYADFDVTAVSASHDCTAPFATHCKHDTSNMPCGGPHEDGCTCVCRKCPDGYWQEHSCQDREYRCTRCPDQTGYSPAGICLADSFSKRCPEGTVWKCPEGCDDMLMSGASTSGHCGCFTAAQNGQALEYVMEVTSITCPGGAVPATDDYYGSGPVKCYTACPAATPRLTHEWKSTMWGGLVCKPPHRGEARQKDGNLVCKKCPDGYREEGDRCARCPTGFDIQGADKCFEPCPTGHQFKCPSGECGCFPQASAQVTAVARQRSPTVGLGRFTL